MDDILAAIRQILEKDRPTPQSQSQNTAWNAFLGSIWQDHDTEHWESMKPSISEQYLTYLMAEVNGRLRKQDREANVKMLLSRPITTDAQTWADSMAHTVMFMRDRLGQSMLDEAVAEAKSDVTVDNVKAYREALKKVRGQSLS